MPSRLKIICTVCLFAFTGIAGWSASVSKDEKPAIPADLFYNYKPVPEDENAIVDWQRASKVFVPLSAEGKEASRFCWTPGMQEPSAEDLAYLQNWVKENQEALRLFDSSLRKAKAQWPQRENRNGKPEVALSYLIRARLFEADQLAKQKKFDEAIASIKGSLRLLQMGINGHGAFLQYLIAENGRVLVQGTIMRLASRNQTPLLLLADLLKNLPDINSETNIYADTLKVEFTFYDYPSLNLKDIAATWSKVSATNLTLMISSDDLYRPFRILFDPTLIAFHPKPLDENKELENDAFHFRILRTNSLSTWTNRSSKMEDDREEAKDKLLEDIQPLMDLLKTEPLPLSRQAAERARADYLKIENPVGRLFECNPIFVLADTDIKVFRFKTEYAMTRTILAILIFEREKGVLPARLSDLVDAQILDAVPSDPFSDKPVLYSRERKIVWSVGENGIDDNGEGSEFHWIGDDAVWQIPELK